MADLAAVGCNELFAHDTICSAMPSMFSWWVKIFLSLLLQRKFGWVLSLFPCPFLLALRLEWSFNTSVDKK